MGALATLNVRFMDLMWVSGGSLIQREDYQVVGLCHGKFLDPSRIEVVWSITANFLTCRDIDSSICKVRNAIKMNKTISIF